MEVARCALQLGRLHEAGGGEAVDRQIRGGGDAAAVFQGGDPAVDGADLGLQGAHAAVDGRDRAAEGVEGRHQGVAAVALGLAPAVALEFERRAVAQDGLGRQRAPAQERPDYAGRELLLHHAKDAVAFREGLPHEVPGVQRREVGGGDVAAVRLALRPTVAVDLSVEPLPNTLAPVRGDRSSRFLMIGGKNWFWTSWKMVPLAGPGGRTR